MSPTLIAVLFAVGIALVLTELVTPGVIVGLLGLGCLGTAVYFTFQHGVLPGVLSMLATVAFAGAVAVFAVRRLTMSRTLKASDGYQSADPALAALLGKEGSTMTPLQPSGYCRLEGRRVQVVSRGEPIEPDVRVKVIEVEGNRVVVKRA